jgi:hypothetical protein
MPRRSKTARAAAAAQFKQLEHNATTLPLLLQRNGPSIQPVLTPRKGKNKKSKKPKAPVMTTMPGVIEPRDLVPRRKGRMAGSMKGFMTHKLGVRGDAFIHRHCNPCGEFKSFSEYSKIPDGSLPSSAAIELRQVLIVRAPTSSSETIDLNTGAMWTLSVIHTAMFRTPVILIANMVNAEVNDSDKSDLITAWNTTVTPPVYPEWQAMENNPSSYWCTVEWSGLSSIPTPTDDGAVTTVSQYRICADGLTIFNNTPDLINQGMVIGAQWNTNKTEKVYVTDPDVDGVNIRLNAVGFAGSQSSTSSLNTVTYQIPANNAAGFTTMLINGANLVTTYVADREFTTAGGTVAVGDTVTLTATIVSTVLTSTFNVVLTNGATTLASNTIVARQGTSSTLALAYTVSTADHDNGSVTQWQLPPLTTQELIQDTPKAVYMSMKEQNGVYMVKRIFQPVFNVTEASDYKRVRLVSAGQTSNPDDFIEGKSDTFDANFSTGVIIMSSIPVACAPAFKMFRDLEVVATNGSPWSLFMKSNDDKIPAALEIVESISTHHPFMYPESYNSLGGLMGIISSVVGQIPVIGQVLPIISNLLGGLLGAEKNQSGASQNVLASLNTEELAKLLPQLLQQLGVK